VLGDCDGRPPNHVGLEEGAERVTGTAMWATSVDEGLLQHRREAGNGAGLPSGQPESAGDHWRRARPEVVQQGRDVAS
jgi:hypothetical protein